MIGSHVCGEMNCKIFSKYVNIRGYTGWYLPVIHLWSCLYLVSHKEYKFILYIWKRNLLFPLNSRRNVPVNQQERIDISTYAYFPQCYWPTPSWVYFYNSTYIFLCDRLFWELKILLKFRYIYFLAKETEQIQSCWCNIGIWKKEPMDYFIMKWIPSANPLSPVLISRSMLDFIQLK